MLIFACLLAAAAAAPATTYDQRQDGDFNVRADVQNVVFVVAVPEKLSIPSSLYGLFKNAKHHQGSVMQDRADIHVMEAFVEPSEPYHVEIGESSRHADGDSSRAVEVVIAGRRRLEADAQESSEEVVQPAAEVEQDEYKLIGATEQCGPDRERDPATLMCRARADPAPADPAPATAAYDPPEHSHQVTLQHATPEVIPASTN